MLDFNQLVSVNFQGTVVVFGRSSQDDTNEIYFNVLGKNVDVNDETLDWSGFSKLEIPQEVRQVGMSIITVDTDKNTLVPTNQAFRVITDQKYISIVQQSTKGTLYVNRFRLLETRSGTDQKTKTYTLSPAWEVRYSRSRKEDVPADKSDTQEYLDPDGDPFLEPSLELSMIASVAGGAFDVLLLPISGSSLFAWQFFALDSATSTVSLYNFPATENGLFDVTGKTIGEDFEILPDSSFTLAISAGAGALPIQSAPRAALYVKHEKVVQPDGSSIGVKRASRVMIAVPVKVESDLATATIDTAVSTSGTMADLSGEIVASNIVPAEFDLVFDGVGYLELNAPSSGGNPLEIKGPYTMGFMVAPSALGDDVVILGDDGGGDPKTKAPYVSIVDGDKLEVGFGNGTEPVSCRTLNQVLMTDVWTTVAVSYAGAGDNPFTISINGSSVLLTACSTAAEPSGTAVSRVGGSSAGFQGALNSISVGVAGTEVVMLPCNSVDYAQAPPATPNTAPSGVTATVFGPKTEPSSSPVNTNMSGTFYIDAKGLTYYAGIADFIQPHSPTCLIDASDGLLHLYYQGAEDLFSVAQFSTESARATFYVDWTTDWTNSGLEDPDVTVLAKPAFYRGRPTDDWSHIGPGLLVAPDTTQTGFLNFVAHRVGAYMNATEITVTSSKTSPLLCDMTVKAPEDVGTEYWVGLPRDVNQLSLIWNGAGSNNPDDQDVLDRTEPYFDYKGEMPSVLVPSTEADSGDYFLFISVPFLPLKLASVTVAAASPGFVQIGVEVTAPSNWDIGDLIVQEWPDVPAEPTGVRDVFAGTSTAYDYSKVQTTGTRAYGLAADTARSDDQVSHVVIFVKDALKDFSISVEAATASGKCNVTINNVSLPNVPRDQNAFAKTINGENTEYTYPEGYQDTIASQIYGLTNGLSAEVRNSTGQPEVAGALAYAGLLRILYMGPEYDQGSIAPSAKTAAEILQGARLEFNGQSNKISGSALFGSVIVSPPTDGGIGKIGNTSGFTDGKAPVLAPGINGGWMPQPPRFCLGMNEKSQSNYVAFDVDKAFSPSNELAILSDMTVETWLNQDPSSNNLQSRALTYNVMGNRDNPDLPVQYMAGSMLGPGLNTDSSTFVKSSFNFSPPNLTVQLYIKLPDDTQSGSLFLVSEVMGSAQFVSVSLTPYRKLEVNFLGNSGTLSSQSMLPANKWTCVTLTVADAGGGNVDLGLYLNAEAPETKTVANSFTGSLGAFMVGSQTNQGLKMTVNGASFWQRALTQTEVQDSFSFGFPDNDPLLGIRWNFAEGTGTSIMNSAATGPDYNATVINPPNPAWDANGVFYVPYLGRNDYVLASNRILKGWTHVALASQQGYALALNGENSGKVEDGAPFNPAASFNLEAWVKPDALNSKQIIVEKPGSYSFYINTFRQVSLDVHITQDGEYIDSPPVLSTFTINAAIGVGETSYVAVNFNSGSNSSDTGSKEYVKETYFLTMTLFVNGKSVKAYQKTDFQKPVAVVNETSSFYLGKAGDDTFAFEGLMSHVRVWSRTLGEAEIAHVYALHLNPENMDGLTAGWNFDDRSGTVATDLTGNVSMQLSSNQLWTIWQDVAQGAIYVNGRGSSPQRRNAADVGGYGEPGTAQFTLGGVLQGTSVTSPFCGELDDVRLFSTLLTGQQIRESMNKPLIGNEEFLAGYWKIDAGSGNIIYDMRGMGNNGTLLPNTAPPAWKASSAPIKNEGQSVLNVLDGGADHFIAKINGEPSVIEFGSSEKDAYDKVYSVMKRGYFYLSSAGNTVLNVEYKVGDLDTIYVGQVQSKPSVVGYIEGGPPIPSENQTLAYWSGDMGGPTKAYETVSSVTYSESDTKTWSFTANQSALFTGDFNIKGGFYQESKSEVSVGLGAEATTQILKTTFKLGAKSTNSGTLGGADAVSQSHSNTTSLSSSLTPAGEWEPSDNILNPVVGRRYIQNNIGVAIVKSATADLFMMALKGTQTAVGYTLMPNTTIPVDTNIIDFPINPKYIKNGTLDGKVGLVNDPDYPNADAERGSYFKPVEAYALKRNIEKEEQQIAAYYAQFSVNKYRVLGSLNNVKEKLKENTAYNFSERLNQRSIYNNYVWTAVGGLNKEEHSVANSYSETYTGTSSFKFALGAEIKLDIGTLFGGFYLEADAMLGGSWTMTATKSAASSNAFSLVCSVSPTSFLAAPIMSTGPEGQLKFDGYSDTAAPGKVDGYRYMSFLLAPSTANFTALNSIIDQNWLNNSTSAAAAAMREAVAAENGTWRILYRTTYVSRVPAPFQPVKDDTNAPNITPPANLASNYWLVRTISDQIRSPDPTPLEIGTAIDVVLGSKAQGVGLLKDLISWWTEFYAAAQVYGTDEFKELAELRVDLLNYMVSKYEAEKYLTS